MPLYEYQCQKCGSVVEVIQKFSDLPLESCDKCGGALQKLLSSPAIQFKGAGWYITDYSRKGDSAPPKSKSESGSDSSEATGKSAESKGASDKSGSDSGKSDSGKSDSKSDSGKSDSGKSDSGKKDTTTKAASG